MVEAQKIDINLYRQFSFALNSLSQEKIDIPAIGKLLSEIKEMGAIVYGEYIKACKISLQNLDIAISVVDIPKDPNFSDNENFIYNLSTFIAIFSNISTPICYEKNVPFRIHKATHSSTKNLSDMGVKMLSLEDKLGFHNDGLVRKDRVDIPKNIALLNSFIGYRKPGYFHWIPTKSWEYNILNKDLTYYKNNPAVVTLTPTIYENSDNGYTKEGATHVIAPLVWSNSDGKNLFFLNGEVTPEKNNEKLVNFCAEMRESIAKNPACISVEQKEGRAIFLNNTAGFHARDIFADPISDVDLSRVLIRALDADYEICPNSIPLRNN